MSGDDDGQDTVLSSSGFLDEPAPVASKPPTLAATDIVPAFRADLQLVRKPSGDFEVRGPGLAVPVPLNQFEVSLARMLNGRRPVAEILESCRRLEIPTNLESLQSFLLKLERAGLLAAPPLATGSGATAPAQPGEGSTWSSRAQWENSVRSLFQSGVRLLRMGKHDEAAGYFEALLGQDPDNIEARELLEMTRQPVPAPAPASNVDRAVDDLLDSMSSESFDDDGLDDAATVLAQPDPTTPPAPTFLPESEPLLGAYPPRRSQPQLAAYPMAPPAPRFGRALQIGAVAVVLVAIVAVVAISSHHSAAQASTSDPQVAVAAQPVPSNAATPTAAAPPTNPPAEQPGSAAPAAMQTGSAAAVAPATPTPPEPAPTPSPTPPAPTPAAPRLGPAHVESPTSGEVKVFVAVARAVKKGERLFQIDHAGGDATQIKALSAKVSDLEELAKQDPVYDAFLADARKKLAAAKHVHSTIVVAPRGGMCAPHVTEGADVHQGQVLADIK